LQAAPVDAVGDHRIAMAAAVAALVARGSTRITGWDAVRTSYPTFEADLRHLLPGGTQ
ncbi:MAG: 3-phosphoshikimate 1-carboxyvinyltransferase, partial [Acidimicrobiia bacterium]|nr:3-phosphoshikimate 1-carboxyvinyltransferase [Acidimicrobiia bacterium]